MTQWTDDELRQLLADTFSSREPLADPAKSRDIASGVTSAAKRRRRWPVVAAAAAGVCAVVAGSTFVLRGNDDQLRSASPTPPSSNSTDGTRSYAANRVAAAAESARVAELVPLPGSAVRLAHRPSEWSRDSGMGIGPSDGTLTRTSWWSVPTGAGTLQQYLLHHHPNGMTRQGGIEGGSDGVRDVTYNEPSPKPNAFIGVILLVQWKQVDGQSWVRGDTFTAARSVRAQESYVTGTVTSIDITRVVAGFPPRQIGGPLPALHLSEPADKEKIAALVAAANRLHGSIRPPFYSSCPYPGNPVPSVTITFHTSDGMIRMHLDQDCWGQIVVHRDGRLITPTLESGKLITLAERLVPAPKGR